MLTENGLRELLQFTSPKGVLSVYLNTDPAQGNADAYRLRLRTMLKEIDQPTDVEAVLRYFDREYDWSGKSVVVFSCAAEGFFRAFPVAVSMRERVRLMEQPYVKPLADLFDSYGGYGVALVDKQGARLFFFHLGELREQEGTMGEEVRHVKRGGASTVPGRRGGIAGRTNALGETIDRNMKEAADFAVRFFEENRVRRVLLCGSDENVTQFRTLLPKAWQSLVVGTFAMSMTAGAHEVQEKAMQIAHQAEERRKTTLVSDLITTAAKGAAGVLGLDGTLSAVHEGRVHTLVLTEGFRAPGYQCAGCGYLTTHPPEKCIFCSSEFQQIDDAAELAVRRALQSNADVEFIHSSTELQKAGSIGALLRY